MNENPRLGDSLRALWTDEEELRIIQPHSGVTELAAGQSIRSMATTFDEFVVSVLSRQRFSGPDPIDEILAPLQIISGTANPQKRQSVGRRALVICTSTRLQNAWVGFCHESNIRITIEGVNVLSWIYGDVITLCAIDTLGLVATSSRESLSCLPRRDLLPAEVLVSREGSELFENLSYMRSTALSELRLPYLVADRFRAPVQDIIDVQRHIAGCLSAYLRIWPSSGYFPNSARDIDPIYSDHGESQRILMQLNAERTIQGPLTAKVQNLNDQVYQYAPRINRGMFRLPPGADGLLLPFLAENTAKWNWNTARKAYEARIITMRDKCNEGFEWDDNTTPETLHLISCFSALRYYGGDELFAMPLRILGHRLPDLVSYGKVDHDEAMKTGYKVPDPVSLDSFVEEDLTIMVESWLANHFKMAHRRETIHDTIRHFAVQRQVVRAPPTSEAGPINRATPLDGSIQTPAALQQDTQAESLDFPSEGEAKAPISFFDNNVSGSLFGFGMIEPVLTAIQLGVEISVDPARGRTQGANSATVPVDKQDGLVSAFDVGVSGPLFGFGMVEPVLRNQQLGRVESGAVPAKNIDSARPRRVLERGELHNRLVQAIWPTLRAELQRQVAVKGLHAVRTSASTHVFPFPPDVRAILGREPPRLMLQDIWELDAESRFENEPEDAWLSDDNVARFMRPLNTFEGVSTMPVIGSEYLVEFPNLAFDYLKNLLNEWKDDAPPARILCPAQHGKHWVALCAKTRTRTLEIYDSGAPTRRTQRAVCEYFQASLA
jgi:hypothetical protein